MTSTRCRPVTLDRQPVTNSLTSFEARNILHFPFTMARFINILLQKLIGYEHIIVHLSHLRHISARTETF
jgi:hypothetical protein